VLQPLPQGEHCRLPGDSCLTAAAACRAAAVMAGFVHGCNGRTGSNMTDRGVDLNGKSAAPRGVVDRISWTRGGVGGGLGLGVVVVGCAACGNIRNGSKQKMYKTQQAKKYLTYKNLFFTRIS